MNSKAEFDELINSIIEKFSPNKIILFGSRAMNNFTDESDYDLLVLKSGIEHKRKFAQDLYKLLLHRNIAVDFIVETPENYESQKVNPYVIFNEITKYGKLIYERQ
ncbi:MAG: polymerase, beta-like region [Ignavibacteria bacterium]|nr:polymerase, beta-like region [Ignavibacteria bacterium]